MSQLPSQPVPRYHTSPEFSMEDQVFLTVSGHDGEGSNFTSGARVMMTGATHERRLSVPDGEPTAPSFPYKGNQGPYASPVSAALSSDPPHVTESPVYLPREAAADRARGPTHARAHRGNTQGEGSSTSMTPLAGASLFPTTASSAHGPEAAGASPPTVGVSAATGNSFTATSVLQAKQPASLSPCSTPSTGLQQYPSSQDPFASTTNSKVDSTPCCGTSATSGSFPAMFQNSLNGVGASATMGGASVSPSVTWNGAYAASLMETLNRTGRTTATTNAIMNPNPSSIPMTSLSSVSHVVSQTGHTPSLSGLPTPPSCTGQPLQGLPAQGAHSQPRRHHFSQQQQLPQPAAHRSQLVTHHHVDPQGSSAGTGVANANVHHTRRGSGVGLVPIGEEGAGLLQHHVTSTSDVLGSGVLRDSTLRSLTLTTNTSVLLDDEDYVEISHEQRRLQEQQHQQHQQRRLRRAAGSPSSGSEMGLEERRRGGTGSAHHATPSADLSPAEVEGYNDGLDNEQDPERVLRLLMASRAVRANVDEDDDEDDEDRDFIYPSDSNDGSGPADSSLYSGNAAVPLHDPNMLSGTSRGSRSGAEGSSPEQLLAVFRSAICSVNANPLRKDPQEDARPLSDLYEAFRENRQLEDEGVDSSIRVHCDSRGTSLFTTVSNTTNALAATNGDGTDSGQGLPRSVFSEDLSPLGCVSATTSAAMTGNGGAARFSVPVSREPSHVSPVVLSGKHAGSPLSCHDRPLTLSPVETQAHPSSVSATAPVMPLSATFNGIPATKQYTAISTSAKDLAHIHSNPLSGPDEVRDSSGPSSPTGGVVSLVSRHAQSQSPLSQQQQHQMRYRLPANLQPPLPDHTTTITEDLESAAQTYNGEAAGISDRVDKEGCITVVDPQRRKIKVPVSHMESTKGLNGRLTTPSLCLLYQSGRCRQGANCYQVHADPGVVQRLRREAELQPCCCAVDGDANDGLWEERHGSATGSAAGGGGKMMIASGEPFRDFLRCFRDQLVIVVTTPMVGSNGAAASSATMQAAVDSSTRFAIPLRRTAYTIGLDRMLQAHYNNTSAITVPAAVGGAGQPFCPTAFQPTSGEDYSGFGEATAAGGSAPPASVATLTVSATALCRLHGQKDGCRFGADCKFLHVCRTILQTDLAPLMSLVNAAAITSSQHQQQQQANPQQLALRNSTSSPIGTSTGFASMNSTFNTSHAHFGSSAANVSLTNGPFAAGPAVVSSVPSRHLGAVAGNLSGTLASATSSYSTSYSMANTLNNNVSSHNNGSVSAHGSAGNGTTVLLSGVPTPHMLYSPPSAPSMTTTSQSVGADGLAALSSSPVMPTSPLQQQQQQQQQQQATFPVFQTSNGRNHSSGGGSPHNGNANFTSRGFNSPPQQIQLQDGSVVLLQQHHHSNHIPSSSSPIMAAASLPSQPVTQQAQPQQRPYVVHNVTLPNSTGQAVPQSTSPQPQGTFVYLASPPPQSALSSSGANLQTMQVTGQQHERSSHPQFFSIASQPPPPQQAQQQQQQQQPVTYSIEVRSPMNVPSNGPTYTQAPPSQDTFRGHPAPHVDRALPPLTFNYGNSIGPHNAANTFGSSHCAPSAGGYPNNSNSLHNDNNNSHSSNGNTSHNHNINSGGNGGHPAPTGGFYIQQMNSDGTVTLVPLGAIVAQRP